MRPITAKGGITGTDLPALRKKGKLIDLRPHFKLREDDYKALQRVCKQYDVSMSEWIRRQVVRSLGNE